MSISIKELSEHKVFKFFEEMSMIPRGSGNEKEISDYLVKFAKDRDLDVIQEKCLNVIIKKAATKGYENSPTVILQGHMDMVCEKNNDTKHDFLKDPLKLKVEGDWLKAEGTTLGADNGIAVAYCLALLDSDDIPHPAIEVLVTTEEETGMGGVMALEPNNLSGKLLINIDSEEEGIFFVSCAGGVRNKISVSIEKEENKGYEPYLIKVRGLKGGHSGMDIDKGKGNSNKIMGRVLSSISELDFRLSHIEGGSKMNAIPREADAVVNIKSSDFEKLNQKIVEMNDIIKKELSTSDSGVSITLEKSNEEIKYVFTEKTTNDIINMVVLMPNGVQTMSMDIEGLVESSTNLGVVSVKEDVVMFESAVRSSVKSLKYAILNQTKKLSEVIGADWATESDYPEWEFNKDSYLRELFERTYKDKTGKEAQIKAIHAGLECGFLKEKLGDVDMISMGPDMKDVHTPEEALNIPSTKRTWEFFKEILKNIK